jgi:hypothetical protein
MMARSHAATTEITQPRGTRAGGFQFEELPFGEIEVPEVVGGMVNRLPKDRVPPGSARYLVNARVRDDWTGRRPGTREFGPTKPNSSIISSLVTFIFESGDFVLCRISSTSFHILDATLSEWIPFSIEDSDGEPTTFPNRRTGISFTQYFEKLYIADGENKIWEVEFSAQRVREIDEAPPARYITTFGNRIIAANVLLDVGGTRTSGVAWSENADPQDWTGIGSGFEDLAETDIGDAINGIHAVEDVCVIVRRRSIWHITRQPFATAPFSFRSIVTGVGSDLPHTVTRVAGGIIFADQRTRDVYFYTPGSPPQPLAANVNRNLYDDLRDVRFAQGTFDPFEREYHLGLVTGTEGAFITKVWVYSLEHQAWMLDDGPEISTIGIVSLPGQAVRIMDLEGDIDSQFPPPTGTIDDYGDAGGFSPTLFKGLETGEVLIQDYESGTDFGDVEFEFLFQSPDLGSVSKRRTMKDLRLKVSTGAGGVTLEQSRDEEDWRNTKEFTVEEGEGRVRLPKTQLTGTELYWRVKATAPRFRIYSWFARVLEKGIKR